MAEDELRKKFHHPYNPYNIQQDLMLAIYECIEQSKVGIFESPTGTGKSLSLICGSLSWLRDSKRADFDESREQDQPDHEPAWLQEHARQERRRRILENRKNLEARLDAVRNREAKVRKQNVHGEPASKRRRLAADTDDKGDREDDFMLDDYQSDDDRTKSSSASGPNELGLSSETQALMDKLGMSSGDDSIRGVLDEVLDEVKIYFCSRTHSQLGQFIGELRRVKMPSAYPVTTDDQSEYPVEPFKQLSLSSRKQLCINEKVAKLKNPTSINERCLELQSSKTAKEHRCQFMPNQENQVQALDFQHFALAKIRDIEDLGGIGRKIGICPYYASRPAIKPSEIVTLPYPLLLQTSAREALEISLKDNIVIIDEAHNLMDAILGLYTTDVSLSQLQSCRDQLATYLQKFRNRLKGRNRVYVTQVVRLIDSLKECMATSETRLPKGGIIRQGELLAGRGVDQINLYKLLKYLDESRLARKVQGYVQFQKGTSDATSTSEVSTPVLTVLGNFLMALTNPAAEGRFFYTPGESASGSQRLKYLLLDPSEHFREIVDSARSVILVGGTMSPMDDYINQLFPYLAKSRLSTLSCGHVIPASSLYVSAVTHSSGGMELDFTFASRNSPIMLNALGETLLSYLSCVPHGAVIFFPSYSYLEHVLTVWKSQQNSTSVPVFTRLESLKHVFVDSSSTSTSKSAKASSDSNSSSTDDILASYTAAIMSDKSTKGSVLLSVIGGRLSEGINFSDRLGRLVVVIGLPYPNPHVPEFKARAEYIESKAAGRSKADGNHKYVPGHASREFSDNLCMRAVNQAIGRAVRHKDDWSAILLVDKRYTQSRIVNKLPGWIKGSLHSERGPCGSQESRTGVMKATDVRNGLVTFYKRMGEHP